MRRYWAKFWSEQLLKQREMLGAESADQIDGSERSLLAESLAECYPFESLLEIGCAYGQLLHIIAAQYPGVKMIGVDPDAERIAAGNAQLKGAGIRNALLSIGVAEDLSAYSDRSFDVVIASAAMLFVAPEKIDAALMEMRRVAKKAILLLELHREGRPETRVAAPAEEVYWTRDYRALLSKYFESDRIIISRVANPLWKTETWKEHGHLIHVRLA